MEKTYLNFPSVIRVLQSWDFQHNTHNSGSTKDGHFHLSKPNKLKSNFPPFPYLDL